MIEKLQGIVLNTVRHSDRASIVSVYTRTHGRLSLLVNVGSGKSARRQAPMLMPLAQVEFESTIGAGKELLRPRGLAFTTTYRSIYFSPVKNTIAFFLAEFLNKLLRLSDADPAIFLYIRESLLALDMLPEKNVANYHLIFLSGLASFMGISPDIESYTPGALFDMRAGTYSSLLPGHNDILIGDSARIPLILSRLNYANMHLLKLRRADRASLLDGILHYWAIHFPGLSNLNSPEILTILFD
ncbi:MAG: recombination protein O N-terminal domain-containing protein [Muribaculaceae bacterium]|nr:recombination protein O N-terminal domain-containing protein [Muribaculaceae bacterium]